MNIYIRSKDYSVTHESFDLIYEPKTDMLITHPRPKELDRYYESEGYISHTDSKETLMDKMYQFIKRFNLGFKLRIIKRYRTQSKTLLDVGAGTGDFLVAAQKKGWKIVGVEPNKPAADKALSKKVVVLPNINSVPTQKFNIITLWHVLEHLPDLDAQIGNLIRLLEKDGALIIAVPNYKSYDAQYYKEYWAAYDVPRHLWHFSKTSIYRIFKEHDMEIVKMKPMLFDAFYVSLLSEKYKTGKSNLINVLWVGLRSNLYGMWTKEYSSHIYILRKR
ncbi:MAG TPA: class I SAM-dependent methyltransferase [Arenibacter sp.]|nr:class I SAM-dependent methyltransferase [Arenibacter sp.]